MSSSSILFPVCVSRNLAFLSRDSGGVLPVVCGSLNKLNIGLRLNPAYGAESLPTSGELFAELADDEPTLLKPIVAVLSRTEEVSEFVGDACVEAMLLSASRLWTARLWVSPLFASPTGSGLDRALETPRRPVNLANVEATLSLTRALTDSDVPCLGCCVSCVSCTSGDRRDSPL
ncbi:hypothetical protein [Actimicrobium antarcticum]|uniref:hypothetical protein n=1 Tax=Actimicrobium antarcticum TaxID=1051899 RepID=UPI0031DC52AE